MKTVRRPTIILAVLMLFAITPVMAEVFRVQLKNGNSFVSRYQPKVAEWDENKVVFLTDVGNRITLPMEYIADIVADSEVKGFGTVIDTTTIVLGWAPNDAPTDGGDPSAEAQFEQYLESLMGNRRENTVQQFVNTEDAGGGGLSPWEFGGGNFSGGQGGNQPSAVVLPARPAPPGAQPGPAGGGGPAVGPVGDGGGGDGS